MRTAHALLVKGMQLAHDAPIISRRLRTETISPLMVHRLYIEICQIVVKQHGRVGGACKASAIWSAKHHRHDPHIVIWSHRVTHGICKRAVGPWGLRLMEKYPRRDRVGCFGLLIEAAVNHEPCSAELPLVRIECKAVPLAEAVKNSNKL